LKSSDLGLKYEAAIKFYNEGKYMKAYPLFEELVTIYRGTAKAEQLYYMYAYCDYNMKDYLLAAHRFSTFAKTFPTSKYVEECLFMSALCNYHISPKFSLDQADTYQALEKMELFITKYPKSAKLDTCHQLIDILRAKLEKKSYEIAKQYLKTEDFKGAIVAFKNLLIDFPDTKYREEIVFLILKSHFLLAQNSVSSKKYERYNDTIKAYYKFADSFPQSQFSKLAENYHLIAVKEKDKNQPENI
jgi:outer membrane protein assembly factor BamD